jgi:hypothetical protein
VFVLSTLSFTFEFRFNTIKIIQQKNMCFAFKKWKRMYVCVRLNWFSLLIQIRMIQWLKRCFILSPKMNKFVPLSLWVEKSKKDCKGKTKYFMRMNVIKTIMKNKDTGRCWGCFFQHICINWASFWGQFEGIVGVNPLSLCQIKNEKEKEVN